ncbi:MAG: LLM class flavin-dependent oxidoreductase [Candidatus Bathyarchaeia archaeon]
MAKIGIAFWRRLQPADVVECSKHAERRGFTSAWMVEGHGGDAFSLATACALGTERILLGTSVVSVFVRSPPTIALGASVVNELSGGRFILGLGSSHKVQVQDEHGIAYEKPTRRIKETVEIVRNLLSNGQISHNGEIFKIKNYDLWFEPRRNRVPIYLSAVFPGMLRLAGQIADGILLVWCSEDYAKWAMEHVEEGAEMSGRGISDIEVASVIPCCVSEDEARAKNNMRSVIAFYVGFFPRYRKLLATIGFERNANMIGEAWKAGDKDGAAKLVSDRIIDTIAVAGTPEHCRRRVEEYRKAGVSHPILLPTGTDGDVKSGTVDAINAF